MFCVKLDIKYVFRNANTETQTLGISTSIKKLYKSSEDLMGEFLCNRSRIFDNIAFTSILLTKSLQC